MRGLLVLLLVLVAAPSAHAATVTFTAAPPDNAPTPEESCSRYAQCPGARLSIVADPGEINDISFDAAPPAGRIVMRDGGSPLRFQAPCEAAAGGGVSCPSVEQIRIDAGDGNDAVTGTAANDTLIGGTGADVVRGMGGSDTIVDEAVPEGDRQLDGGEGTDTISFEGRSVPVAIDLSAATPGAGSPGESNITVGFEMAIGGSGGDTIRGPTQASSLIFLSGGAGDDRIVDRAAGAATVQGGAGNDTITGNRGTNTLEGEAGNDVITGGENGETINGGAGRDRIKGGGGGDSIEGVGGDDDIEGGDGNDALDGGPGRDRISGGRGNDTILARERGRDRINCGAGRDGGTADRTDRLTACERVRRR